MDPTDARQLDQPKPHALAGLRGLVQGVATPSQDRLRSGGWAIVSAAATAATVAAILAMLGANPATAFKALVSGALGNKFNFGQTVMITTLLALTGLAAAIPFSARLWNVGGEGQMYFGAFCAAGLGLTLPASLPHWFFAPLVIVLSAVGGAVWGLIPGALKALINANEVIVSLMSVFVALLLADYAITVMWPQGIAPQTADAPANTLLPNIWSGTLVTAGAPVALLCVIIAWVVMARTRLGFQIRAVGLNPHASRLNGMRVGRIAVYSFMLGGAFAGTAGAIAVVGIYGNLPTQFSGNFGFLGIAVALLARLSPIWILPSAFFFAILRVGSNGLQVATGLSPSVGEIIVATFVILLLAFRVIRLRYAEAAQ
jgi:simple sugar transport system permease protein